MKQRLPLLLLFLGTCSTLHAQDLITTRSGEDIKARVTEIGLTDVKYKRWENLEGAVSTLPKGSILLIRYEDGGKEIFEETAPNPDILLTQPTRTSQGVVSALNNGNMFMRGQLDAKRYYRDYKSAGTVALVSSLILGPIFGLIPTVIMASTAPEDVNLNYPSETLMHNREYASAYVSEAKRIKSHKSWTNYGIGLGVSVAFTLALLALFLGAGF